MGRIVRLVIDWVAGGKPHAAYTGIFTKLGHGIDLGSNGLTHECCQDLRDVLLKITKIFDFPPNGLKPPASSWSASANLSLIFISCAHAILPQISRRVGHKISLQGFAGSDAWTDSLDYRTNLRRNGGPYRARCAGPRPCAYVLVDTAKAGPVQRHAAHQRPLVATDPDGVPWVAQALLGKTLLGQRLFLNHLWKCHWRYHHAVFGITFL